MIDDFPIIGFSIITQVLHLEYTVLAEAVITHIDHEYIFYSEEEYSKRETGHTQKGEKGENRKRYKTFKS